MSLANPYPLAEIHAALIDALNNAASLSGKITGVYSYFAQYEATVEIDKLTIYAILGDSEGEEPDHSNAGEAITGFMPTTFSLICDTTLADDADTYITKTGGMTLTEHERAVVRGLQESKLWGVPLFLKSWRIGAIQRELPVLTEAGDIDPQVRRFQIDVIADMIIERTDGAV